MYKTSDFQQFSSILYISLKVMLKTIIIID